MANTSHQYDKGISIHPIPTTGKLFVEVSKHDVKKAQITLYNLEGRQMLEAKLDQDRTHLDVSHLAKGVYLFTLKNDERELENGKLILE